MENSLVFSYLFMTICCYCCDDALELLTLAKVVNIQAKGAASNEETFDVFGD